MRAFFVLILKTDYNLNVSKPVHTKSPLLSVLVTGSGELHSPETPMYPLRIFARWCKHSQWTLWKNERKKSRSD